MFALLEHLELWTCQLSNIYIYIYICNIYNYINIYIYIYYISVTLSDCLRELQIVA